MRHLLHAELLRYLGSRLWRAHLLAALICGAGMTGLITVIGPQNVDPPMPALNTAAGTAAVLSLPLLTLFVPAALASFAITAEYRHGTIGATFLAVPRRGAVLLAKVLAHAGVGLVYGALFSAGIALALYSGAALHGTTIGVSPLDLAGTLARLTLAAAVYAMLGVAVGALFRHQIAALAVVLGYFYLIEPMLLVLPGINQIYPWLPGGATAALTQADWLTQAVAEQTGAASAGVVPSALGLLLLLGYAAAAALIAVRFPLRRDLELP